MFGFCSTRSHESCPGSYERFYIADKGRGRTKVKNAVNYTGEIAKCSCKCHKKGAKK